MGLLNIFRRMRLRQKLSIREIARLTGVSRNTVTKHLATKRSQHGSSMNRKTCREHWASELPDDIKDAVAVRIIAYDPTKI
jgi:hypothetical protein